MSEARASRKAAEAVAVRNDAAWSCVFASLDPLAIQLQPERCEAGSTLVASSARLARDPAHGAIGKSSIAGPAPPFRHALFGCGADGRRHRAPEPAGKIVEGARLSGDIELADELADGIGVAPDHVATKG
jgi:hypothetical protein